MHQAVQIREEKQIKAEQQYTMRSGENQYPGLVLAAYGQCQTRMRQA